jgi:hypothetical protein
MRSIDSGRVVGVFGLITFKTAAFITNLKSAFLRIINNRS